MPVAQRRTEVMRWEDFRRSDNIEDRRDESYSGGGGGGFGMPGGAGGLGIGTVVVLGLVGWALGIDPRLLIGGAEMVTRQTQHENPPRNRQRHTRPPPRHTGQVLRPIP